MIFIFILLSIISPLSCMNWSTDSSASSGVLQHEELPALANIFVPAASSSIFCAFGRECHRSPDFYRFGIGSCLPSLTTPAQINLNPQHLQDPTPRAPHHCCHRVSFCELQVLKAHCLTHHSLSSNWAHQNGWVIYHC